MLISVVLDDLMLEVITTITIYLTQVVDRNSHQSGITIELIT